MLDRTIAAIATAPGEAGIGIVRISGEKSIEVLKNIFIPKKSIEIEKIPSRMMVYGHAVDNKGETLDEVLAVIMRKPYSYTMEDVVELHCHGGIVPVRRIMEEVLKNGADIAEAGEFTKRAFLNGRIDLAQAEAVIDVITSKTGTGLNAALNQLEGELSKEIKRIMESLISMLAHIEASIDFPEHDIEEVTVSNIKGMLLEATDSVANLIESFEEGKIVRDGLNTAIIGRPNVGKSSLLNVLLKENRAIVTEIPGTTRDIIEEYLNMGGVPVRLIDTAGIRDSEDIVERIGVERTKGAIEKSDLVILVMDASDNLQPEDNEIIDLIRNKKTIVALNKTDLGLNIDERYIKEIFGEENIIKMSVKNREGIDMLEERIEGLAYHGKLSISKNNMVTNIRHKNLLDRALTNLERAVLSIEDNIPIDIISVDIRDAWNNLGSITGDTVEEDIVREIFSKFCIGK
ncbi:MAG: tRNA uridine-5-carboxymethylaminomethyl(34) synthesis GTPase MnmE [Clostridiaceae bacterium]|nr:tRNA uridine-5-carboxymethylaminomethyl(34) synthesis GTPase MnmE [Clostridiaceae bacterium]